MLTPQKGFHGLGPVISGEGETVRFGHDGLNEGFISSMVGYENFGQGAVVMANSGFSFMLIKEVLDSIARAYKWQNYDFTNMQPPDASQHTARFANGSARATMARAPPIAVNLKRSVSQFISIWYSAPVRRH